MPLYDFRCRADHSTEHLAGFDVSEIVCPACGLPARRSAVNLIRHTGFVPTPTKEHYIPLSRAIEAQHEMVYQAEKHGVQAPDLWKEAKRRVAAGEVKAIGDGRYAAD